MKFEFNKKRVVSPDHTFLLRSMYPVEVQALIRTSQPGEPHDRQRIQMKHRLVSRNIESGKLYGPLRTVGFMSEISRNVVREKRSRTINVPQPSTTACLNPTTMSSSTTTFDGPLFFLSNHIALFGMRFPCHSQRHPPGNLEILSQLKRHYIYYCYRC